MNDLLLKALDLGGTLTLALAILTVGGRKIDGIDDKLDKITQLIALGFSSDDKKQKVRAILEKK